MLILRVGLEKCSTILKVWMFGSWCWNGSTRGGEEYVREKWNVAMVVSCSDLLPLNVTLYRLLSFNNQHTDTDGKQNIHLGRVFIVLQGISVLHRVNSPGWPQLYRLDWWLLCCWPEDRILSIMWGNLGPSAVWSPSLRAPCLAMCGEHFYLISS